MGKDFKIINGLLIKSSKKQMNLVEHAEEYNIIITFFNIIGIPIDFITPAEIIVTAEDEEKKTFTVPLSSKAIHRGKTFRTVGVNDKEKSSLNHVFNFINTKIIEYNLQDLGDIFKYFGYGCYYFFHNNYNLSFINSFMFIEPVINRLWKDSITEKFGKDEPNPLAEERNWTLQHKIDEMYMMGKISSDIRKQLQLLRTKRNQIFHVHKNIKKRKADINDALNCMKIANILFYKLLGAEENKILIVPGTQEIRKKIGIAIFGDSFIKNIKKQKKERNL
jgi:hypothetical protein